MVIPVISIILGLIYMIKPNAFGGWPGPKYHIYTRILGVLFFAVGVYGVITRSNWF